MSIEVNDRVRFQFGFIKPNWLYGTVVRITDFHDHIDYHTRIWNDNSPGFQIVSDAYDKIEKLSEDEYQAALLLVS